MLKIRHSDPIKYFEYKFLADRGTKAILTGRSDQYKSERKFKAAIYQQLGLNYNNIIQPMQIHSSSILIIKQGNIYNNKHPISADAVITNKNKITLQGLFADCVPIYFYNADNSVRALVHSGWKGTGKAIAAKTLGILKSWYSIKPQDVHILIGPSISQKYYEVDKRVYKYFQQNQPQLISKHEQEFFQEIKNNSNKFFLDLKSANYHILNQAGADPRKIYVSDLCTYSNPNFYSYRKEGNQAGRMLALLIADSKKVE